MYLFARAMLLPARKNGQQIVLRIAFAQRIQTDESFLIGIAKGGIFALFDLIACVMQQHEQRIKVCGFLFKRMVNRHAQPFTMRRRFLVAQPLIVAFAMPLRMLYNGVSVFNADGIVQPTNGLTAAPEVAELAVAVQRNGVPNDVIMDVFFINMGTYNIGMIAFSKTLRQFLSQTIGFLRRNLSRQKGLAELIRNDVPFLCSAGKRTVFLLG